MRIILIICMILFSYISANQINNQNNLQTIEKFLSSMNTLEAEMTMETTSGNYKECYKGKIWLDREKKLLRIDYGKNSMVAKNSLLTIFQENENPQEFSTEDTPAGLLLRPSINFEKEGITVKSLTTPINNIWVLSLTYHSPAGEIPVTMYFKPAPVMLLMGWTIQNPDGSITDVHLDLDKTHMAIVIPPAIFELKKNS